MRTAMSSGQGPTADDDESSPRLAPSLLSLPPDVIFNILLYCDIPTLGRLCQVCKRLNWFISQDYVWIAKSKKTLVTNQLSDAICKRSCCYLYAREKCRISTNWRQGRRKEMALVSHHSPYMPWIHLERTHLWYTKGSTILRAPRSSDGTLTGRFISLRGHMDDICRFVCKDGFVVSGGRDGSICGWRVDDGRFVFSRRRCHNSDVNSVDMQRNVIVSGSRDRTVKVWSLHENQTSVMFQHTILIRDRVWDLALMPNTRYLLIGSAGHNSVPPLQLYDLERSTQVAFLGGSIHRNGAGVLNIHPESPSELLSCGYDTYVRLWDIRCANQCVFEWDDPHDSAVYCVTSDHNVTVLSGTSRYGLVRLWDKRMTKSVQMYYVGKGHNSPVYCVAFDPCHMYVALDRSLNLLSFDGQYRYDQRHYDANRIIINRSGSSH